MENVSDKEDLNRAWENIREKVKISAKWSLGLYELKQHKTWFDIKNLRFLDQMMQVNCSGYRIQNTTM
jgi:hypothetical protein